MGAAVDVEDDRLRAPADSGDRPGHGGQRPSPVIFAGELAGPGVEDLDDLRSGSDLEREDVRDDVGEQVQEALESSLSPAHHLLDRREGLRARPLDQVTGERPRRPGKADDRGAVADLAPQPLQDFAGEAEIGGGIETAQPQDVVSGPDRMREPGTVLVEFDLHAHRLDRDQDVGEEDDAVRGEAPERLERHLGGEVRVAAELDERDPAADLPILRKVSPGLSHHPGRGAIDGAPVAGIQEPGRGRRTRAHRAHDTSRLRRRVPSARTAGSPRAGSSPLRSAYRFSCAGGPARPRRSLSGP